MVFTQLYVGQTGVRGFIEVAFPAIGGGIVRAYGNFPSADLGPQDALSIGKFEYFPPPAVDFAQNQQVLFDIAAQDEAGTRAYATNLQAT